MAEILRTAPNQPKLSGFSSYKSTPVLREGQYVFNAEPFLIPIPTNGAKPGALEVAVQGAASAGKDKPYSTAQKP